MLKHLLVGLPFVLILAACGAPAAPAASNAMRQASSSISSHPPVATHETAASSSPTMVTMYQNEPLPTPIDSRPYPPPAWLVAGDQKISASIGSYNNLDAPPLEEQSGYIATVEVHPEMSLTLVLARGPVEEIEVTTRTFGAIDTDEPLVLLEATPESSTVFRLPPITVTRDKVLSVFVRFAPQNGIGGDAEYRWRLVAAP